MDYYIQQTNEAGEVEYIRAETLEVADEAFFADSRYQKVVNESVDRRKKIRELNKQIKDLQVVDAEDEEPVEEAPAPATMTPDQIIEAAIAKIDQRNAAETAAKTARNTQLEALLTKHKLPKTMLPALEKSNDPEGTAEILGRTSMRFDDVTGGETAGEVDITGLFARIDKELGL